MKVLKHSVAKADRRTVRHALKKLVGIPVAFAPECESPIAIVNRKVDSRCLATR